MKKVILHHRSSHHSGYSGYAKLIEYIDNVTVIEGKSILSESIARFAKKRNSQKYGLYDSNSVHKNFQLIKYLTSVQEKVLVHYLNGERDIRQAIGWFPNKSKNIATFHKPPEILSRTISDTKYLQKLSGAIAVGINQVDFLKNWLDLEQVQFIPHGVDTSFFYPDENVKKENTLLFVGQHLRDFEALNYAIPRLKEKIPNIKINAVLRQDFAHKIISDASVTIFSGLNDEHLRTMYQEATLLFLPLLNCTACNSILEAMACGLPVITSDVGGNYGYVKENCGLLIPDRDYMTLVDRTILLLKDQNDQNKMSANARLNALSFNWENVVEEVTNFYNLIN